MMSRGADPLDAIVAGVQIVELDPKDQSVGLAGLPNEDGVVQLDASVMHGPTKRAGSVGALEDVAEAAAVAQRVMEYTDHIMLVGAGAKRFALEMGFKERNLLTEESRHGLAAVEVAAQLAGQLARSTAQGRSADAAGTSDGRGRRPPLRPRLP